MKLSTLSAAISLATIVLPAYSADYSTVLIAKQPAVADRAIARFKTDAVPEARNAALAANSARINEALPGVEDLVVVEFETRPRLNAVLPSPPTDPGKDLLRRIKELESTGVFQYAEPDYVVTADVTPTDAAYHDGRLWGLNNTGANGGVIGADIQAEEAWSITTGSTAVVVAVIDSGVNYLHQDLAAQMWINAGEIPGNSIDDDGNGYVDDVHGINAVLNNGNPLDDNSHGSHVAGTIGAAANNGSPHVGVAWNVRLMAVKFLDADGGGTTSDAIESIAYARNMGAKIMNNSWGGGGPSQALFDAIAAARNEGCLFLAAAGNSGVNNDIFPHYPSSFVLDNIISVAAIDRADELADFSNYGVGSVHLGAPGVAIFSSTHWSPFSYDVFDGTSMACPHVAGVAALLWADNPSATYQQIRLQLFAGTVPVAALQGKTATGGRLNALNALTAQEDGQLEITISTPFGFNVFAGDVVPVHVRITDLFPVPNGSAVGTLSTAPSGPFLLFQDNGQSADETAGDGIASAFMNVPFDEEAFSLSVTASAPGKQNVTRVVTFTVIEAPSNDDFANRKLITGFPLLVTGANELATREPHEPTHARVGGGKSVWWSWTATASGTFTVSTEGSLFDTVLGVYTGPGLASLTLVGENDDAGFGLTSAVVFQAQANRTYHIAVDGWFGGEGRIQLGIKRNAPLSNDNFAKQTPIDGINVTVQGLNFGATAEVGEPPHAPSVLNPTASRSVWWSWSTGISRPVTISTTGSSFDTRLAVYTGSTVSSLAPVAQNDNVGFGYTESLVQFNAQAGVSYKIAVDGALDQFTGVTQMGSVQLSVAGVPFNDSFSSPLLLNGEIDEDQGLTIAATAQTGEPALFGNPIRKSVWWRWTAPRDGKATITTDGSSFDTALGVYTGASVATLTTVAENGDRVPGVRSSLVSFEAREGTTYHIQVDGWYDPIAGLVFGGLAQLTVMMDGRSHLTLPELRADGTTAVELVGEPGRVYILSASSDLEGWSTVSSASLIGRRVIFTEPSPSGSGPRFFRAFPKSLIAK